MRTRRPSLHTDSSIEQGGANLTPLIDVVFVVLIFFILIAPLVEVDQIQLAKGAQRDQPHTIQPSHLVLHVNRDNTLWINKSPVAREDLKEVLKTLRTSNPKIHPQLYQDKHAFFGTYQMVKNALEEAGFETLDIIVEPGR